tara:strand:- start:708 stop:968 length:261 start_codon:yes stop_codon:yes gene_type:complete
LIEIYSTNVCPYCDRAKQLLDAKGATYTEYFIDQDLGLRQEMLERCGGRRTVPQIIIAGQAVGGFDDIKKLEQDGLLDALLTKEGE